MKDTATGAAPQLNKTRGTLSQVITRRERKNFEAHPVSVRVRARTNREHHDGDRSLTSYIARPNGAVEINAEHQLAVESASGAITHAIKCGELLIAQKTQLKHGEFGAWIEKHCAFKQATANNYMKAAQNPNAVGNSIRHLYESGRKVPSTSRSLASNTPRPDTDIKFTGSKIQSVNTPDSVFEDRRERGGKRVSVDYVIEDLISTTEAKFHLNVWNACEPHLWAIDVAKAAEFKKRAATCRGHFARLARLLGVQS